MEQARIYVSAPIDTPAMLDDSGNVVTEAVTAVALTPAIARAAAITQASAVKAAWLEQITAQSLIGAVTL